MEDSFSIRFLENEAQIDRLFPVANLARGLSLERWRTFARATLQSNRPGGILVVEDSAGYVVAFCCVEAKEDLVAGPILSVENLMAVELVDRKRVVDLLLERFDNYARERGLAAIQIVVPAPSAGEPASARLARSLAESGYRGSASHWAKCIGLSPRPRHVSPVGKLH